MSRNPQRSGIRRRAEAAGAGAEEDGETDLPVLNRDCQVHLPIAVEITCGDVLSVGHKGEVSLRAECSVAVVQHHRSPQPATSCEIELPIAIQIRRDLRVAENRILLTGEGGRLSQRLRSEARHRKAKDSYRAKCANEAE